jgi:hypothetical protein
MELTVAEINTLIEAVDAWISADKTNSMLAGLFMGALISQGEDGDPEKGKEAMNKMMEGSEEKKKSREDQGTLLKAKLIMMRDKAEVKELAITM